MRYFTDEGAWVSVRLVERRSDDGLYVVERVDTGDVLVRHGDDIFPENNPTVSLSKFAKPTAFEQELDRIAGARAVLKGAL